MYILDYRIDLNGVALYVEIEFERSPLVRATRLDPPEGEDITLNRVYVSLAVGTTYEVGRRQMGGWEKDLDRLALDWVECYMDEQELHDYANNTEDSNVW